MQIYSHDNVGPRISESVLECRVCDANEIEEILDLGPQPPANSLRADHSEQLTAVPLILCRCKKCGTLQLTETVNPEYLFGHYVWVTGTSEVARKYSKVFSDRLLSRKPGEQLHVFEVASNDGTFLKPFQDKGHKVVGIDPAKNIADLACKEGILTIPEFFGSTVAESVIEAVGKADIIFARNVIPHVADPNDVVSGLAKCLKEDGIGAIEFHSAQIILDELHYDSIYHEHIFYHSLHSMELLLKRHELYMFDVLSSPISGGSLVAYFSKIERPKTKALTESTEREASIGIGDSLPWIDFAKRCREHSSALRLAIERVVHSGKKMIGYGASARSSTLLNYCGLGTDHLELIVDKNPLKSGLFAPGTDLQILPPETAMSRNPDVIVLLAWNFREEILGEIREKFYWKGTVIIPLPGMPQFVEI